jgi:hypothetical protein
MQLPDTIHPRIARRTFLGKTSGWLGATALATLLVPPRALPAATRSATHGVVNPSHHRPRAKRVIFLYMSGGPSQFETFDNKPKLAELSGAPMPASVTNGQPIAQLQGQKLYCLGPQFPFRKYGQSAQEISEVLPQIGSIADEICIVRSMVTDAINHDPAHTLMNTGTTISGRPSMGSWIHYGLGSENADLPGFIVLTSQGGRNPQPISTRQWHHGFLPAAHQGIQFHSQGAPVPYLGNPAGIDFQRQRDVVEATMRLNHEELQIVNDPEISARIAQLELAFRMQSSVPALLDIRDETEATRQLYGVQSIDGSFAANCLLARRMAERGVRFIQLYHRGWDHHNDIKMFMGKCAGFCDQASAALIKDLKQRGMLEESLVIWGGEFGRTPMSQSGKGEQVGRDHHMRAFSIWLAGGGIRPGITYGSTDELGYHAVENIVHVHDLHATILHLLGIDHLRLTVRFQGRDFRLTDVAGTVVSPILA